MFLVRCWVGSLLNLIGIPGFVRDCEYSGVTAKVRVAVRTHELFTIVSVNGLDIYFHRLTGKIDGIGFSLVADCKQVLTQELKHLVGQHADLPPQPRTGKQ